MGITMGVPELKHVKIDGVSCYGEVRDNSNFYIICTDEEYDGVWADGNPESPDGTFKNWTEVVRYLKAHYRDDIEELQEV